MPKYFVSQSSEVNKIRIKGLNYFATDFNIMIQAPEMYLIWTIFGNKRELQFQSRLSTIYSGGQKRAGDGGGVAA